ncbi:phosphatase PAP2 family protein [Danxiaibacter flavus]|uniref:Phosphatase PAP2 family protein n=1 Tax=Danxiaibacter flavus TaxID=3049108 RepID=A0ABV3ZGA1_9BACT|nr:phosphatase PAP2 family protein [Chitinophagaceae bacterium DXS]
MQNLNHKNFTIASIITFLLGITLLSLSFIVGKIDLFLLLNTDLGIAADWFFRIFTNAGDGAIWVAILIIVVWGMKRKDTLPLLISSFVLSTVFTQICKYVIVPDEPRPFKAIADHSLIHTVEGVDVHLISSFPSGHTATAFTCYILFALLIPRNWWLVVGLIYGLAVGYSRVYLAQHFPLDVSAGMLVAVLSVALSIPIQNAFAKRRVSRKAQ